MLTAKKFNFSPRASLRSWFGSEGWHVLQLKMNLNENFCGFAGVLQGNQEETHLCHCSSENEPGLGWTCKKMMHENIDVICWG